MLDHQDVEALDRDTAASFAREDIKEVGRHARALPASEAIYPRDDAVPLPRQVAGVLVRHAQRLTPAQLEHVVEQGEGQGFATQIANR